VFLQRSKSSGDPAKSTAGASQHDALPGGDKATLTLEDGSTIVLDSAADGALAKQGNTRVVKLTGGRLAYHPASDKVEGRSPGQYNTVTTPRGGQYQVALPDGTNVWLNATSSIRFPTAFSGGSRTVEISGEAYFEVADNPRTPFIVKNGNTSVEVLGTHFNVNAYQDEPVKKITLLQGAIRVRSGNQAKKLAPGEAAELAGEPILVRADADVAEAVAWKNGLFSFKDAGLPEIMRQLSRWYDLDVRYDVEINEQFNLKINRNTNITTVLKIIETMGSVHFTIEGKRIYVK